MKQTRYLIFLVFVAIVLTGCSGGGGGSGVGGIIGLVTYEGSGLAVIDAYVEIAGRYAYTNADGSFRLNNIPAGAYTMTIRHPGIRDGRWTQSLTIPSWDTRSDVFRVPPRTMPVTTGDVGGWVYVPSRSQAMALGEIEPLIAKQMTAPSGYEPLRNAKVTIAGQTATTGNYGNFYFERVPAGYQTLTVSHASLRFPITRDINVLSGGVNWVGDHGTDYVVGGVGYYVTIGADKYYEDTTPLPGPRDDALAVHNELFNRNKLAGFGRLLIRNGGWGEPTKANIRASIQEAVRLAESSSDYLVIYFSGRTGLDFLRPIDDQSGEKWITDGELENWVSGFPGHVTLIVDGAHSESMADGIPFYPQALRKSKFTVLSSARKGQEAWHDKYLGNGKLSVFTHFLVDGMASRRADVYSPIGDITALELYEYVDGKMEQYDRTHQRPAQVPQIHEGYYGDTVIYRY